MNKNEKSYECDRILSFLGKMKERCDNGWQFCYTTYALRAGISPYVFQKALKHGYFTKLENMKYKCNLLEITEGIALSCMSRKTLIENKRKIETDGDIKQLELKDIEYTVLIQELKRRGFTGNISKMVTLNFEL
jgi:hypothetical protein